ncbi:Oidioi.mRNA.OKI2018_I69.chr2.g6510.t1.cds [Oikopleura dioica]|uniref:Oidioi.mRNA.OKI2018_I69.chr2.g6510.t1.cds n=1 Tax=Oikopleura dioica TaxID=34765 RepID=A0ABN7T3A1_OIKDI|nr:Oidioi.mRNA.OKI2018_I69.chr2.g6510.t1.cds [Oikopleura dioica]
MLLFGGNPGIEEYQNDRMCDFWCFQALNEDPAEIMLKLRGLLLEAEFLEIKAKSPTEALTLLRSEKSVDLLSRETRESLAAQIFESSDESAWSIRSCTFSQLMKFLNEDLVEPRSNLQQLISNSIDIVTN